MIYVWIRGTVDWSDEEAFWAQVPDRFRPRAELWNATFRMPFHVFRKRVREIAALNQSRVRDVIYAEWDQIPDGARVVPVDDDDWFSPALAETLESKWGTGLGVRWTPRWIGVPADLGHYVYLVRRGLLPFTRPHWTCETNNYAIVKTPDNREMFEHHLAASQWFDGPGRERVTMISDRLSVHNRNLGSQTSLRPTKRRGELTAARLRRRLGRHKLLYRRPRWQRTPQWARPYVAMMAELMDELEPR